MNNRTSLAHITTSSIFILFLVFAAVGCGSTGSDSDSGPDFDSGLLAPGEAFSFTFEEEGRVDYYCRTHQPNMTGVVTVSQGAEISSQDTVVMENTQFNPSQITIAPNTTIVWINREDSSVEDHTVTSGKPSAGDGDGGY